MEKVDVKKLEQELGIDIEVVKRAQTALVETNATAHDIDYVSGVLASQPKGVTLCTEKDLRDSVKGFEKNLEILIPMLTKILTSIKKGDHYAKKNKEKAEKA